MAISRACWWAGAERVLVTLWVGGLWIGGYLVAPILFANLDRQLAGRIAGEVFFYVNAIGVVAGSILLLSVIAKTGRDCIRDSRAIIVFIMLLLVATAVGVLQPMMQELKLSGIVPGSEQAVQFGRLHGVSSILHLLTSLLGLWLVATGFQSGRK